MLHPISMLIPLAILLPNVAFYAIKPNNTPEQDGEKIWFFNILTIFEGVGRLGVFVIPVFSAPTVKSTIEIAALVGMLVALIGYYGGWIRFFMSREYKLLFSPMANIPVPMAVSPIVYFLCASVILDSPYLMISGIIFALAHIPISLMEYRRIAN